MVGDLSQSQSGDPRDNHGISIFQRLLIEIRTPVGHNFVLPLSWSDLHSKLAAQLHFVLSG